MNTQTISIFKPSWKQIVVSIFAFLYIAINIFQIGGDAFVINLNNFVVIPLALGVTLLALILLRQMVVGSQNRLLWSGLTIGWALWTVAELWWGIASFIGQELPYPSWADFLWLAGYVPMFLALWLRTHSLPKINHPAQRVGLWVASLVSWGGAVFFVLIPTIQNNDPTAILENIINILYPLANLILLLLVLQIFFAYQQGIYGRAWVWLTLGFVFSALGDLAFVYAETTNLYYPDQQINLLSTLGVDVPYNLSYLLWLIGLFTLQSMQSTFQVVAETDSALPLVPNTHLLVFTEGDSIVTDVSKNFSRVFPENAVKGKTISEVLGISPQDADMLLKVSRKNKTIEEHTFWAKTRLGQEQVCISGIVIFSPQGEYSGIYFLLRMLAEDYSLDQLLTDHEKSMVNSILSKTGTKQKEDNEVKQLLANYYGAFLQKFYNRVLAEGGSIMADAFIIELASAAPKHGWQMDGIRSNSLLNVSVLSLSEIQKALPALFETAKQFTATVTDKANVETIIQDVRSKFGESALKNVSHFE